MGSERTNRMPVGGVDFDRPGVTVTAPEDVAEVRWTMRSGLPVVWADSNSPFNAGLIFRVGRTDELAPYAGITHLVEHLALPNEAPPGVEFNGFVAGSLTSFWARGDEDAVLALLANASTSLSNLPDRLEIERRILLTEAERRGFGVVSAAAAARFGPRGDGLSGYREFGLRWLSREQVSAWAANRFNFSNAVMWMTGEPPAGLEIPLPAGVRYATSQPEPIADVNFPTIYPFGSPGGVALSLLAPRTTELSMVASIAVERARHRIRHEEGLSYLIDMSWEPLTATVAHAVFMCDCQEGRERSTALLLRNVLEELAGAGPTEEEVSRELDSRRTRYTDPAGITPLLFHRASDELLGKSPTTTAELLLEAERATTERLRTALEDAMESALLLTRDERPRADERWSVYPAFSPVALPGRLFTPARPLSQRLRRPKVRLHASAEGLTFVTPQKEYVTVRFADCAVAERWPGTARVLIGADSSRLVIRPAEWHRGEDLLQLIEEHLPEDRVVPMNPTVEERAEALAQNSERRLRADIESTAEHVNFGEVILHATRATYGEAEGTLLLTHERLIFTFAREPRIGIPLHEIVSIRLGRNTLRGETAIVIETGDDTHRFEGLWPARVVPLLDTLQAEAGHVAVHDAPRWTSQLPTVGSYIAFPLSFLALFPLAALEDVTSHLRIVLLSVAVVLVCGGICAIGVWLGWIGRRRASANAYRSRAATIGLGVSLFGLLLWVAMAVAVLLTEW